MALACWLQFLGTVPATLRSQVIALIERAGVSTSPPPQWPEGLGIIVFDRPDPHVLEGLSEVTRGSTVLAVTVSPSRLDTAAMWRVPQAEESRRR
jgi:hypothetical protein